MILLFLILIITNSIICKSIIINQFEFNNNSYELPRFWTNTGFSPSSASVSNSLLSPDMRLHLNLISSLPNNAITTIRVHWLLDLIKFVKFRQHNIPEYDFQQLDEFLGWINESGLAVGFEFMGNPGIFNNANTKNISNSFLWMDLTYQIVERNLEIFGYDKLKKWKFESWNEPDLKGYNTINFTIDDYLNYLHFVKRGLNAASLHVHDKPKFLLRGPAGLFKSREHHPLCWSAIELCNKNPKNCPFDVLTFHRKGNGQAQEIIDGEKILLTELFNQYPNLTNFAISNDEADPISGWSTPRAFQSDIRYAVKVVEIILTHWKSIIIDDKLLYRNFESISHDNAFLSYHPYEFDQRTLFARFQMNKSKPIIYSQFIAKPVFVALGMLGNLAQYSKNIETFSNLTILNTFNKPEANFFLASVIVSSKTNIKTNLSLRIPLPSSNSINETFAFCLEALETNETNPVEMWNYYGRPSYPNETVREWMRRVQGPKILETGILKQKHEIIKLDHELNSPWIAMLRVCSSKIKPVLQPFNLRILKITRKEVLILWNEILTTERCIKTHVVEFMRYNSSDKIDLDQKSKPDKRWKKITRGWRVPFLSFQFQPKNGIIAGYYRVRAFDIFGRSSRFSDIIYFS